VTLLHISKFQIVMIKCYDHHFENYIDTSEENNFHPKVDDIISTLPDDIHKLHNIMIYGRSGTGKYTQSLRIIKKYSISSLKYEKRMHVDISKGEYIIKMSDIHFEVDMSLLGCNAKIFWHEIYNQIVDIVSSRPLKACIILCKNIHMINSDLLDVLYSYIQQGMFHENISIKFIFITESVCFLPDTILNTCEIIGLAEPPELKLKRQVKKYNKTFSIDKLVKNSQYTNIKTLYEESYPQILVQDTIIQNICNILNDDIQNIKFLQLRDIIYDLFIYEVDVSTCIWEIVKTLISSKQIRNENISIVMCETYKFFRLFNNNYRPIYHIERYFYVLNKIIRSGNTDTVTATTA